MFITLTSFNTLPDTLTMSNQKPSPRLERAGWVTLARNLRFVRDGDAAILGRHDVHELLVAESLRTQRV